MADSLDSIVKGAPVSVGSANPVAPPPPPPPPASSSSSTDSAKASDPLNHTPSAPSMIYLNLLILEASLRAQYLELRARRRHHTFFLSLLALWIAVFGYALFLAPREDGSGVGGSVYWMVESTERICFLGGIMTGVLVWAVGIWERGVRWPRRWLAVSNRGLRGFNCKLVINKRPWWREILSTVGWLLTYGMFSNTGGSSYRFVEPAILREVDREMKLSSLNHPTLPILSEDEEKGGLEEDLAPGGDYVKLLLLPKPFSATFRENWDLYRTEYWERENERRWSLRARIEERDRKLRRQQHGGWFWWLPWRRNRVAERMMPASRDAEKQGAHHHAHHRQASENKRPRSGSATVRRGSTASTASSRTPTPTRDLSDDATAVSRRSSTASNVSEKRKKSGKLSPSSAGAIGTTRSASNRSRVDSRSVTPEIPSPLAQESKQPG